MVGVLIVDREGGECGGVKNFEEVIRIGITDGAAGREGIRVWVWLPNCRCLVNLDIVPLVQPRSPCDDTFVEPERGPEEGGVDELIRKFLPVGG